MNRPAFNLVLSSPLQQLLIHCQINCTADCCRANAFQISADMIARWLEFDRVDRSSELAYEIQRVKELLDQSEGDVVLATRGLESSWPAGELKAFWGRLESAFASAVSKKTKT